MCVYASKERRECFDIRKGKEVTWKDGWPGFNTQKSKLSAAVSGKLGKRAKLHGFL